MSARQVAALMQAAELLSVHFDQEHEWPTLLESMLAEIRIHDAAVFLFEPEPHLRHAHGALAQQTGVLDACARDVILLHELAAARRPTLLDDSREPEGVPRASLLGASAETGCWVPIAFGTRALGVLLLIGSRASFSLEGLLFARAVAAHVAYAVVAWDWRCKMAADEQRYRTLMDHANDVVSVLTPSGHIRDVNVRTQQILGYDRSELIGRRISEFAAPGRQEHNLQAYEDTVAAGAGRPPPSPIRRRDGSIVFMEFSNTTLEVEGEVLVLSIGRDVTERLQAHTQLMISDRLASIGMLAAGVVHEINNPLAAVLTNLELAAQELSKLGSAASAQLDTRELRNEVEDARDAALRMRTIIKELRLFSRADDAQLCAVDVHRAIDSALRMAWSEIKHRARLSKDFGRVPLVVGNEARLGQVFLNLLLNAAQAIPEGRVEANQIRIVTRTVNNHRVEVTISDTGCGIPAGALSKLFEPFFTTKPPGEGTGLGLPICQRIVSELGGTISAASDSGVGATFCVSLRAADATFEHVSQPSLPAAAAAVQRGRVLIIDDELAIATSFKRALEPEHEVEVIVDSAEALARIRAGERYEVILCDLMMPRISGMDLHAELLRCAPDQADKMVFISGGALTARTRAFIEQAGKPCLEKPIELALLRAIVNQQLRVGA